MSDILSLLYEIIERLKRIRASVINIVYTIAEKKASENLTPLRNYITQMKENIYLLEGLIEKIPLTVEEYERERKMLELSPEIVKLKQGEIKKLDENFIVEKTANGKIILYEVEKDE